MNIEKNGKIYKIRENTKSWTVSITIGQVDISYNIQKVDCPVYSDLKAYIVSSDLF